MVNRLYIYIYIFLILTCTKKSYKVAEKCFIKINVDPLFPNRSTCQISCNYLLNVVVKFAFIYA